MDKFKEVFEITESIKVFCVTADSFPEGIMKAHQKLHSVVSQDPKREYFGISWGGPSITYKAGATEIQEGELEEKGLESFTIRPGKYLAVVAHSYEEIKDCIEELISDSRVDPSGYCVEAYLDDKPTIRCMVTMK